MSSNSWTIANYEFRLVANEQEKYLTFSLTGYPNDMLKIQLDGSSPIQLIVSSKKVYQKDPICRRDAPFFESRYGFMSRDGFKFKESENMSYTDCELKCWNNCSCAAYSTTHLRIGCEIWGREANFTESYREFVNSRKLSCCKKQKVVSIKNCSRNNFLGFPVVLLNLFHMEESQAKRLVLSKRKRKKLLRILRQSFLLITSYGKEKREEKGHGINHELKIFDFQVISAATDNFSTHNKLGEGGFGPVYKGQLPDGQEVAIKRLSRRSGQGIVEFENEAKVIAKLQHTNLVKLLGSCLHEEERILVYEYMPNKSLDFFIFGRSLL
ncbi:G-type lectin S-receptor-like serine/threonine-protein kinase CES101 [Pistacia vera]|uniref:G-type lectin S-receptor-like serine/threonine-protein kinase CES101 n=1 Tax=Pistacia vera TaxID=55513 RepID=UPI001263D97C|nr:G-type lectin S-receptor-like serine/threonine-protein kinase CES101 [Pistacia vera]